MKAAGQVTLTIDLNDEPDIVDDGLAKWLSTQPWEYSEYTWEWGAFGREIIVYLEVEVEE